MGRANQREEHETSVQDEEVPVKPKTYQDSTPGSSVLLDADLRARIERSSGIRIDKVEAVCRSIARGEYDVDPDAIAERILRRMH